MNIFHYRPEGSYLHSLHPLTKILILILLSTLSVSGSILFCFFTLIAAVTLAFTSRLPLLRYTKELSYFSILIAIVALSRYLTSSSSEMAARTVFMFLSMILFSIILMDSTPVDDTGKAVALLFTPFGKVTKSKVAATIELTLVMIPLFLDTAHTMMQARKARGERFWKRPVHSTASFVEGLLTQVFRDLERLEAALISRHYTVEKRNTLPLITLSQVFLILTVSSAAIALYLFT